MRGIQLKIVMWVKGFWCHGLFFALAWEVRVPGLSEVFSNVFIRRNVGDTHIWKSSSSGIFSCKPSKARSGARSQSHFFYFLV